MFTGIITEIGTITKIHAATETKEVTIKAPKTTAESKIGDSISINGVCSTIINKTDDSFTVSYMPETLQITSVDEWKENQEVNLEMALTLQDKLSGHLVQGHVDATGTITNVEKRDETMDITIEYPHELAQFIAFKGAITVDGVSLTVSNLSEKTFRISLVPFTIENTIFKNAKKGDKANIEVDMMSRYLKRMFDARDKQSSYEFLKDRGFI